jgi:molybdate transport system substrate-binding protein
VLALLLAIALMALGCGRAEPDRASLTIAAASDLRPLLESARGALEREGGRPVTLVFGSSGQLKEQILAGADFDLFLSADMDYVRELDQAGAIAPGGARAYATGYLVLAWRDGIPTFLGLADLQRDDVRRVAIANPAHAPYGRAAQQALTSAGLWEGVRGKLVLGENARLTADYVRTGNAEAGILPLSLVVGAGVPYLPIDEALHEPIIQGGGVIAHSPNEARARAVLDYLLSPPGQELLAAYGFGPPP